MKQKNLFKFLFIIELSFIYSEDGNDRNTNEIQIYETKEEIHFSDFDENNDLGNEDETTMRIRHLRLNNSFFSFNIDFTNVKNYFTFSLNLIVPINIDYDTNLRVLKDIDINCFLQEIQTKTNQNVTYLCETNIANRNIKLIKIMPYFNFVQQENANPENINAIIFSSRDINITGNITIYIVHNTTYTPLTKNIFLMNGLVSHELPIRQNQPLTLLAETLDEEKEIEIGCIIYQEKKYNYTLRCRSLKSETVDLDYSVAFIDKENLLVFSFDNDANYTIDLYIDSHSPYSSSSEKLKPGTIVLIILSIVFVIAAIIFSIWLTRKIKKKENSTEYNDSAFEDINITK